ncbi:MAG: flippase-like domain-containing protein [Myxococcales bacterium]|nr:flippase-like domain-containing protein [Myxococcales bacterium]
MGASGRPKWLRRILRLLGPLVLVLLLYRLGDPQAILDLLREAETRWLVLAIAANVGAVAFKVMRWQALLRARGVDYPFGRATAAFLSSLYVGMLTPGRVGDVLRIQYLRHDRGLTYAEGLASVVIDRLCDIYVLLAMVALGVTRLSRVLVGDLAVVTWGGVVAVGLLPLVLFVPGATEKTFGRIYARVARDPSGLDRFLVGLRSYVGRALFVAVPLTLLAFLVSVGQGWLIARALRLELGFLDVLGLLAMGNLLGLLPISVSGVGVREAFYAAMFPALGLTAATGVTYGLLVFAVIFLSLTVFGFISWQLAPPPAAPVAEEPAND